MTIRWYEDNRGSGGGRGHSGHEIDPACWREVLEGLWGRVAGRFGRADLRWRAKAFVDGLLADLPRKNCWTLAEHAGDRTPDGMQHLLARAVWDQDKMRDDVRDWLVEHLGEDEAVLVIDESGDLKQGTHTVGVQRQYTGTAGRVENAQVMVLLVYASSNGHGIIDRELYLPRSWTDDLQRCRAAGVPDEAGFATKPELAKVMLGRALDAGVPAGWVTGDEVYGASSKLRGELEARQIGYVLAVACHHPVRFGGATCRVDELLTKVPARAWQCVSAGKGAKGERYYDWAFVRLDHDGPAPADQAGGAGSWSAATVSAASWPSTTAGLPARPRWPSWSGWPEAAGASRSASRPARALLGWTITRSAAGAPGTAGPRWRCLPTPS